MVFQNYALYPHMTVYDNMAFGLKLRKFPKPEIQQRVQEAAEILGIQELLAAQAARPVRRPAPARGGRPRHRAQAPGLPLRRAALQPGRQAARGHARRAEEAPRAAAGHHHLRDPRPGRGHDHGRPDRDHEGRPHPAGRRPAGGLRPPAEPVRGRLHRLSRHELHRLHRDQQGRPALLHEPRHQRGGAVIEGQGFGRLQGQAGHHGHPARGTARGDAAGLRPIPCSTPWSRWWSRSATRSTST